MDKWCYGDNGDIKREFAGMKEAGETMVQAPPSPLGKGTRASPGDLNWSPSVTVNHFSPHLALCSTVRKYTGLNKSLGPYSIFSDC